MLKGPDGQKGKRMQETETNWMVENGAKIFDEIALIVEGDSEEKTASSFWPDLPKMLKEQVSKLTGYNHSLNVPLVQAVDEVLYICAMLKEERDEARRMYCKSMAELCADIFRRVNENKKLQITPEYFAQMMTWDCFNEQEEVCDS